MKIDFEEFRQVLTEAFEGIKRSVKIHGDWSDYSDEQALAAVDGEWTEFKEALARGDIHGEHGVIREAMDVIIVMTKYIRRLICPQ